MITQRRSNDFQLETSSFNKNYIRKERSEVRRDIISNNIFLFMKYSTSEAVCL